jgi:hypothetical protein
MGKTKKDDYRFSLRMNPDDPVQEAVARVLNTKGHCISDFIARAVFAYMGGNTPESAPISCANTPASRQAQPSKGKQNSDSIEAIKATESMRAMVEGLGEFGV